METTRDIMQKELEHLDSSVLTYTPKAFEHYFNCDIMKFVQGNDKAAYIEYAVSMLSRMPEEKTNGLGVLGAFNEAINMAKEQAGHSRIY